MNITNLRKICEAATPNEDGFVDAAAYEVYEDTFDRTLIAKLLDVVELADKVKNWDIVFTADGDKAFAKIKIALAALEGEPHD